METSIPRENLIAGRRCRAPFYLSELHYQFFVWVYQFVLAFLAVSSSNIVIMTAVIALFANPALPALVMMPVNEVVPLTAPTMVTWEVINLFSKRINKIPIIRVIKIIRVVSCSKLIYITAVWASNIKCR